jgi:hypothetical protein
MNSEDRALLRSLLVDQRLLAVAVVVEGQPVVGLLPFTVSDDFSALIVQASALARHSRGLVSGASFSAVLHRPDEPQTDALQTPRLLVDGVVDTLDGDDVRKQAAMRAYVRRFPSATTTLALPDFSIYRLEMRGGRVVGGFARALNLSASDFRDLAGEGEPYNS